MGGSEETKLKVKGYLETATNVAVLLVAIIFLAGFVWSLVPHKRRPQIRPDIGLHQGTVLQQPANVDYTAAPRTLLLVMNTECHYCQESLSFYKKLANLSAVARKTQIVGLFPNSKTVVGEYTQRNQLNFKTVSSPEFQFAKSLGTPTLILTNNKGEVLDFWIGKLSEESELEVVKAVDP